MLYVEGIGQFVKALLRNLLFVDDDGIVEVASLDEARLQEGLNLAHEDEGAGIGNLGLEILHMVEGGKLAVDKLRLEGNHRRDGELVVGQDDDGRACVFIDKLNLLLDDIEVLRGILFEDAHALDILHINLGTAIQNGKLGAIHLYQTVVHAQRIECCQSVLDGAATYIALGHHGAAGSIDHVFGNGINDGLALHVNALNLISVVFGGGIEGDGQGETCMETFSEEGKTASQRFLLGHILFVSCFVMFMVGSINLFQWKAGFQDAWSS